MYLLDGGPSREAEVHLVGKLIGISELIFLRWEPRPTLGARWRTRPRTKAEFEVRDSRIAGLREVLEQVCPDLVYTPFFLDPHRDHTASTRVLGAALKRRVSIGVCYLYEVWSPPVPDVLVDNTARAETKRHAINTHRSADGSAARDGLAGYFGAAVPAGDLRPGADRGHSQPQTGDRDQGGGIPEIVADGESGLLVPPEDPPALAAAILSLLQDPAHIQAMGEAGRCRVEEHFSLPRRTRRLEAIYDAVLCQRESGCDARNARAST